MKETKIAMLLEVQKKGYCPGFCPACHFNISFTKDSQSLCKIFGKNKAEMETFNLAGLKEEAQGIATKLIREML